MLPYSKQSNDKVVPVFNYAPRHEYELGEWRYSSTLSLTSALEEGEWSASRPGRFTPRERASGRINKFVDIRRNILPATWISSA